MAGTRGGGKGVYSHILGILHKQPDGMLKSASGVPAGQRLVGILEDYDETAIRSALHEMAGNGTIIVTHDRIAVINHKPHYDPTSRGPEWNRQGRYATDATGHHLPGTLTDDMCGPVEIRQLSPEGGKVRLSGARLTEYLTHAYTALLEKANDNGILRRSAKCVIKDAVAGITEAQATKLLRYLKDLKVVMQENLGRGNWRTEIVTNVASFELNAAGEPRVVYSRVGAIVAETPTDDERTVEEVSTDDESIVDLQARAIATLEQTIRDLEKRLAELETEAIFKDARIAELNGVVGQLEKEIAKLRETSNEEAYRRYLEQLIADRDITD